MAAIIKFRELNIEDATKLFEIYSDKEAMKYRGSKPMETTEDAEKFVRDKRLVKGQKLIIRKAVELIETKELIGSIMYRFDENKKSECEIGYSIGRAFWGQGFGKEIVKELLIEMKENKEIKDIIAWSNKGNIASVKILERTGFQRINQTESPNNYLYRKANHTS